MSMKSTLIGLNAAVLLAVFANVGLFLWKWPGAVNADRENELNISKNILSESLANARQRQLSLERASENVADTIAGLENEVRAKEDALIKARLLSPAERYDGDPPELSVLLADGRVLEDVKIQAVTEFGAIFRTDSGVEQITWAELPMTLAAVLYRRFLESQQSEY